MSIFRVAVIGICLWTLLVGVADFKRVRVELPLPDSPQANDHTVEMPGAAQIESTKLLVTVGIENQSPNRVLTVTSEMGERTTHTIGPSGVQTVWSISDHTSGSPLRLTLKGSHSEWRLTSVEVSNARGFSRGFINFVIVPRHQNIQAAPAWTWILSAIAALLVLRGRQPLVRSKWGFLLLLGAWGSVFLFLAASVSALVSPFQLVLEPRSYVLGLVLCCVGFGLPTNVFRSVPILSPATSVPRFLYSVAGLVFFGAVMFQALARYDGNYSGFLHVTNAVAARAPFLMERSDLRNSLLLYEHGYDAQFMYLMAFDPLLQRYANDPARYRDVVDHPPYRFGRIGYSGLTYLFSAGNPTRFPATMLWLVLAGHLLLGLALVNVAVYAGAPPWLAATYLLIPGYVASLTFGLPEALAGAGLMLGVYWLLSGRSGPAALAFAVSLLIRETSLLLVVAAVYSLGHFDFKQRSRLLLATLAPAIGWRVFVGARLYADWGWRGFFPSPGDFVAPFAGFADLFSAVLNGTHPQSEVEAAIVYPLVLISGAIVAIMALVRTRSALAAATCAYAAIAVSLNYEKIWMHVPSGERGTIELFLGLLLVAILYYKDDPTLSRRILWIWPLLGVYTFFISPEAAAARAGLLLIR